MKDKLDWLKVIVPGGILAGIIVVGSFGKGPELEKLPERLVADAKPELVSTAVPYSEKIDITSEDKEKKEKAKKKTEQMEFNKSAEGYQDGTYEGAAQGWGGTVMVSVVVKDNKISAVNILSASQETPEFLARAKSICGAIVRAQNPKVDVVSGATYSSNGIINASINALNKAGGKNKQQVAKEVKLQESKPTVTAKPKVTTKPLPKDVQWKNGIYYGEGQGWGGSIKVKVTVKKNQLKSIDIVSADQETPSYFDKAKVITRTMLEKKTWEVDAVSGATYSSNGIKEAVWRALEKAMLKENKATATPTIEPTSTIIPTPTPVVGPLEEGVSITSREEIVEAKSICYPDDAMEFEAYPVELKLRVRIDTKTIEGEEKTVENTYSLLEIDFSEETKKEAQDTGNWAFLRMAAEGSANKLGVFGQLLAASRGDQIDAISGATCSTNAIKDAYMTWWNQCEYR